MLASSMRDGDRLLCVCREEITNKVHDDHDFYLVRDGLAQVIGSLTRLVAEVHPHPTGFLTTFFPNHEWILLPSSQVPRFCRWLSSQTCLFFLATQFKFFCLGSGCSSLPSHFGSAHCLHISLWHPTLHLTFCLFLRSLLCIFSALSLAPLPRLISAAKAPTAHIRALLFLCVQERWLDITDHLTFLCATTVEALWLCYARQPFFSQKQWLYWKMGTDGAG